MTFWSAIMADVMILTFQPPLKYISEEADDNMTKIVDRKTDGYPDSKKRSVKDRVKKRKNSNLRLGHLIISNNPLHSAKHVCEHPNLLGPDFVSTVEGVYCDMSASKWWYLCSTNLTIGCFDLEKQMMRGNAPGHKGLEGRDVVTGRVIPNKVYEMAETWDV